jgi:hypothetical protein
MFGLDAAGKTTTLYKLKYGEDVCTIPTIGFNVETVEVKSAALSLTIWDIGGGSKIPPLWRHYYQVSHCCRRWRCAEAGTRHRHCARALIAGLPVVRCGV